MADLPRSRDCVILYKGDAMFAEVSPELAAAGWRGGQGVQWGDPGRDSFVATLSDGFYCGFALWGSDEDGDGWTGMTRTQPVNKITVVGAGGWIIMTTSFERYTWASRQAHAADPAQPLVPIQYKASDRLVFSNRGFWTSEDEWTLAGDPRAPNSWYIGFVCQAPSERTNGFMTIQVSI